MIKMQETWVNPGIFKPAVTLAAGLVLTIAGVGLPASSGFAQDEQQEPQAQETQPAEAQPVKTTGGTGGRRDDLKIAIMTDDFFHSAVVGQGNFAVRTTHHFAAGRTLNMGRKAAAVEQQDNLATLADFLGHGLAKAAAQGASVRLGELFVAKINRVHPWQRTIHRAFRQL